MRNSSVPLLTSSLQLCIYSPWKPQIWSEFQWIFAGMDKVTNLAIAAVQLLPPIRWPGISGGCWVRHPLLCQCRVDKMWDHPVRALLGLSLPRSKHTDGLQPVISESSLIILNPEKTEYNEKETFVKKKQKQKKTWSTKRDPLTSIPNSSYMIKQAIRLTWDKPEPRYPQSIAETGNHNLHSPAVLVWASLEFWSDWTVYPCHWASALALEWQVRTRAAEPIAARRGATRRSRAALREEKTEAISGEALSSCHDDNDLRPRLSAPGEDIAPLCKQ